MRECDACRQETILTMVLVLKFLRLAKVIEENRPPY